MLALSVSIPLTTLEVDPPTGDCERQSACKVSLKKFQVYAEIDTSSQ